MANIKIFGRLENFTTEGIIAGANQVKDDELDKFQSEINKNFKSRIETLESTSGSGTIEGKTINFNLIDSLNTPDSSGFYKVLNDDGLDCGSLIVTGDYNSHNYVSQFLFSNFIIQPSGEINGNHQHGFPTLITRSHYNQEWTKWEYYLINDELTNEVMTFSSSKISKELSKTCKIASFNSEVNDTILHASKNINGDKTTVYFSTNLKCFVVKFESMYFSTWDNSYLWNDNTDPTTPIAYSNCLYIKNQNNIPYLFNGTGLETIGISSSSTSNNYQELINKPQINGKTLENDKTSLDLGIPGKLDMNSGDYNEIFNDYENNTINGNYGHCEGSFNIIEKNYSHCEGFHNTTTNDYEHAEGSYNYSHTDETYYSGQTIHSIGVGVSDEFRSNAIEVMKNGDVYVKNIGGYDGKNYSSAQTLQTYINNLEASTGTTSIDIVQTTGSSSSSVMSQNAVTQAINEVKDLADSVNDEIALKQDKLVSGTNIKTINGQSLLGNGNITIQTSESGTTDYQELTNKPQINGKTLEGNKTSVDLGIPGKLDMSSGDYNEIFNDYENNTINGNYGHCEGGFNTIEKNYSHCEGFHNTTTNDYEHAEGSYNYSHTDETYTSGQTIHSIGIGVSSSLRSNAIEVMKNGDIYVKNIGGYDGKNYSSAQTLQEYINNLETSTGTTSVDIVQTTGSSTTSVMSQNAVTQTINNVKSVVNSLNDEVLLKQDKLVSGTNIKTIANESILGSGNLDICVQELGDSTTKPLSQKAITDILADSQEVLPFNSIFNATVFNRIEPTSTMEPVSPENIYFYRYVSDDTVVEEKTVFVLKVGTSYYSVFEGSDKYNNYVNDTQVAKELTTFVDLNNVSYHFKTTTYSSNEVQKTRKDLVADHNYVLVPKYEATYTSATSFKTLASTLYNLEDFILDMTYNSEHLIFKGWNSYDESFQIRYSYTRNRVGQQYTLVAKADGTNNLMFSEANTMETITGTFVDTNSFTDIARKLIDSPLFLAKIKMDSTKKIVFFTGNLKTETSLLMSSVFLIGYDDEGNLYKMTKSGSNVNIIAL